MFTITVRRTEGRREWSFIEGKAASANLKIKREEFLGSGTKREGEREGDQTHEEGDHRIFTDFLGLLVVLPQPVDAEAKKPGEEAASEDHVQAPHVTQSVDVRLPSHDRLSLGGAGVGGLLSLGGGLLLPLHRGRAPKRLGLRHCGGVDDVDASLQVNCVTSIGGGGVSGRRQPPLCKCGGL